MSQFVFKNFLDSDVFDRFTVISSEISAGSRGLDKPPLKELKGSKDSCEAIVFPDVEGAFNHWFLPRAE